MKNAIILSLLVIVSDSWAMAPFKQEQISTCALLKSFIATLNIARSDKDRARDSFFCIEQKALFAGDRHCAAYARLCIGVLRAQTHAYNLMAFEDIISHFLWAKRLAQDDPHIYRLSEKLIHSTYVDYVSMTKK